MGIRKRILGTFVRANGYDRIDKCNHVPPNWETMPGAQFLELIETLRSKADSYLDTLVSTVEQQERQREL